MARKKIPRRVLNYIGAKPAYRRHEQVLAAAQAQPHPVQRPKRTGRPIGVAERNEDGEVIRPSAPFIVGEKKIYLPKHVISLMRTPKLPSHLAQFRVPLSFNKFDLRDYLYHVYGVITLRIRSIVIQQRVRRPAYGSHRDLPGKPKRYRPQSIKQMIAELARPFVWPAEPSTEELDEGWSKKEFDDATMSQLEMALEEPVDRGEERAARAKSRDYLESERRMREFADRVLKGEVGWRDAGAGVASGAVASSGAAR